MLHWLYPPKSIEIAKYIDCYWFIEKSNDSVGYEFPKLNPDPSGHLILSPEDQSYYYDMSFEASSGVGSHWLLPHQKTFQLDHSKPFAHLGVKFHIGALYPLYEANKDNVEVDRVESIQFTDMKELSDNRVDEYQLIELARHNPNKCCVTLDEILLPWIRKAKEDQHSKLTRKALSLLDSTAISDIGDLLFCSQRTLERSFHRVTGLTLKQCQAMNKLDALLEYLYQRDASDIDWVEVAYQFGFSDQPHLIRHLKKQIGLTPKTYTEERQFTIDVYGGVNSQ